MSVTNELISIYLLSKAIDFVRQCFGIKKIAQAKKNKILSLATRKKCTVVRCFIFVYHITDFYSFFKIEFEYFQVVLWLLLNVDKNGMWGPLLPNRHCSLWLRHRTEFDSQWTGSRVPWEKLKSEGSLSGKSCFSWQHRGCTWQDWVFISARIVVD